MEDDVSGHNEGSHTHGMFAVNYFTAALILNCMFNEDHYGSKRDDSSI